MVGKGEREMKIIVDGNKLIIEPDPYLNVNQCVSVFYKVLKAVREGKTDSKELRHYIIDECGLLVDIEVKNE